MAFLSDIMLDMRFSSHGRRPPRRPAAPGPHDQAADLGRRRSRPAFDKMMRAARRREIEVVVRLDRLARSLGHLAQVVEELSDLGIELVSLAEALDTPCAGPTQVALLPPGIKKCWGCGESGPGSVSRLGLLYQLDRAPMG